MKVLITAPSLDEKENVSGIASIIRAIIASGPSRYIHFIAGRKDNDKFGVLWVSRQFMLPIRFLLAIRREKPDVVHINTAFVPLAIVRDAILIQTARFARRPVVLHIHGGEFVMQPIENRLLAAIAKKLLQTADKIIVLSLIEKQSLLKRSPGLEIIELPNAIALGDVPEFERDQGEKTIIYFGRLHKPKGLDDIIEACRVLRTQGFKFRFSCYGTGPDKDFFLGEMSAILGDSFHYGGVVTGSEKWDVLGSADIFLLPSRYEGLPVALLEAMAAGCVPVVSDIGSISTVIEDGHNGFLIEPGNLVQIVGKLKVLLGGETGWNELRQNARATIRNKFDIKDHVEKLESIYTDIAHKKDSNVGK